jgi:hypothetical protein
MLNYFKLKNLKGTWFEVPAIAIFGMIFLFIPFFIWSKTLYILNPISNWFTACIAMMIVWPCIISPVLDIFTDWFVED